MGKQLKKFEEKVVETTPPRKRSRVFLLLLVLMILLGIFSFTQTGVRIVSHIRIAYYNFALPAQAYEEIGFDITNLQELKEIDKEMLAEFISGLGSIDPTGVRIRDIAHIGESAIPMVVEAIKKGNAPTRYQGALALGLIKHKSATGPIVELLTDSDSRVRMAAAMALGNIEDNRAAPFLIKCLNMQDKWIRFAASKSLAHMGIRTSVVALEDLMDDPDVGKEASLLVEQIWDGTVQRNHLITENQPVPLCIQIRLKQE